MSTNIHIKAIREALGLSQQALGERLGGLNQATVSRLERGETKPRGLVLTALIALQAEAEAKRAEGEAA
ncbi:MAG: helix-turn-helix domain-containing protein [Parvibaculum sp.]|uniref:helix-turn-helix domain-containing protein n=1 Tax=Parvibaculum sp. TaxID=2024848 RepID=UPI00272F4DF1|nr:helix-turn-helix domain-containing protein [Parvibaculum sp.]MDP1628826.1 helix-turn-helix domain-containing protein [Parvibaculum sp.]MDP2148221.1 helix-turn-helix domain-containing protein [Parvibaculum sp.]